MKQFFVTIFKTPMLLVFCVIVIVYGFAALATPAEINRYAIVTAIGIDALENEEEKFEVSLLTFVPVANQSFTENYKVVSSKGNSIAEALDYSGLHVGREIGLSHIKTVVLNGNLLDQDVTQFLDYLSRNESLPTSTKLVSTDVSAKDFLKTAKGLDSDSSIKISDLVNFNSHFIYAVDSSFDTFYHGLYGPTKVSLIPCLSVEEMDEGLSVAVTDAPSGSGSSGGSEQQSKDILNNGDTYVLKDGKLVLKIDGNDLSNINYFLNDSRSGTIEIDNFSDENFTDANLVFEILSKETKNKVVFENDIPVFCVNTNISLNLTEVQSQQSRVENNVEFFKITDTALREIEKSVKKSMTDALTLMRENQVDIVDFYTKIANAHPFKFKNFLQKLEDPEDYLNHIVFKVSVNVLSK